MKQCNKCESEFEPRSESSNLCDGCQSIILARINPQISREVNR